MADTFLTTSNSTDLNALKAVREALAIAKPLLPYRYFGQKDEVEERVGKLVRWIRFTKRGTTEDTDWFTAETLDSTQNEVRALGDTAVEATLEHLIGKPEGWVSARAYTSFVDIPKNVKVIVAQAAAETINIRARDVLAACTNVTYANNKTIHTLTASDTLDVTDISQVAANLAGRDAYPLDPRFMAHAKIPDKVNAAPLFVCIMHPFEKYYLAATDETFQTAVRLQAQSLFTGHLVDWMGVRFVETTTAPTTSDTGSRSTVSTSDTLIFIGGNAYGVSYIGSQDFALVYTPPGGHADRSATQHALTWKAFEIAKILNEDWLERLVVARATAINA